MQEPLFWTGLLSHDLFVVALCILQLLCLLPLLIIPRLYAKALRTLIVGGEDNLIKEVKDGFSPTLLTGYSLLLISIILSLTILVGMQHYGLLIQLSGNEIILLAIVATAGTFLLLLFDRVVYRFFGFLFLANMQRKSWSNSYQVFAWLLPLPLSLTLFVFSNTEAFFLATWLIGSIFLLWRLQLVIRTFRVFKQQSHNYLLFFLYLCSREVAPLLLVSEVLRAYF